MEGSLFFLFFWKKDERDEDSVFSAGNLGIKNENGSVLV